MESADRLASYLAGDLSPTDAAEVEARLARDPGLAADLFAMQQADQALSTLSSPTPDEGFEQRLRSAVDRELARTLRSADVVPIESRRRRAWAVPLAAAAAAVIGVAGIGLVIGPRTAPDEDVMALTVPDAAEDSVESADPEMGAMLADPESDGDLDASRAGDLPTQPRVVITDRDLTPEDLEAVLHSWELAAVVAAALPSDDARALAADWRAGLAAMPPSGTDVVTCLDALDEVTPLPVTVEVARLDGRPVLVFGLVISDPTSAAHTESRVVVVAAEGCARLATLPTE
ncbi:MAG: hypothetical protein WD575_00180 [Nitriliruptoraceae bacterium]